MASAGNPFWPSFRLNTNTNMPAVGLGTFRIRKENDIMHVVDEALASGYRLFDTASVYGNETDLGEALKQFLPKYDLQREDIFLISKLAPNEMNSRKTVKESYECSVKNLGVDYLDLFLIHFPGQPRLDPTLGTHKIMRKTAWAAMTDLYENGHVNAIGVSNFTISHFKGLIRENLDLVPAVNQVEWHPYYHDDNIFKYCRDNGIVVQGYSPFGGTNSKGCLIQNEVVKSIAAELSVAPSQVLLVWCLQSDVGVIPKSINPERVRTNSQLNFKLSDEHLKLLNSLKNGEKYAWDPNVFL